MIPELTGPELWVGSSPARSRGPLAGQADSVAGQADSVADPDVLLRVRVRVSDVASRPVFDASSTSASFT